MTHKPKPAKLPPTLSQLLAAGRAFMTDWRLYVSIVLVVSLPVDLASLSTSFSGNAQFGDYSQFASLFMNLALLWAIIQRRDGQRVTLGSAYYAGTASILRYMLVGIMVAVLLAPAALGAYLYSLSLQSVFALAPWSVEQLLVGLGCLIISIPSLFFVVRWSLAIIAVVHDDLRPIAAIRRSWRITRRRYWVVAGRLVILLLALVVISIPPTLLAAALALLHAGTVGVFVFQLMAVVLALPIANHYLVSLYRDLISTLPPPPDAPSSDQPDQ
jgi:hypothetical protein